MVRTTIGLIPLLLGLSSCGTGMVVPDADAYTRNPFKDTSLRSIVTVRTTWDRALAPVPCSSLKLIGKTWFLKGRVEANGLVFKDQPLTDPAAVQAIGYKVSHHVGPGC